MTVTAVKLLNMAGSEDVDSISYTLQYGVQTDDANDGPFVVRSAIPWTYGDPYVVGNDSDNRAVAISIEESQMSEKHPNHWLVDVEFGVVDSSIDISNPLNDAIKEEITWEGQTKITYVDASGAWIADTAGIPYQNGAEVEDKQPVLVYSLNQSVFPYALAQQVRNGVNSDTWKGYPAGTVKLDSMSATRLYHRTIGVYYQTRYAFRIVPEGFLFTTPAYGFWEKTDSPDPKKKWKPIRDADGKRVVEPWPLDNEGKRKDNLTDPPAIQNFTVYPTFSFTSLFPFL